jgi:hypothetical protein
MSKLLNLIKMYIYKPSLNTDRIKTMAREKNKLDNNPDFDIIATATTWKEMESLDRKAAIQNYLKNLAVEKLNDVVTKETDKLAKNKPAETTVTEEASEKTETNILELGERILGGIAEAIENATEETGSNESTLDLENASIEDLKAFIKERGGKFPGAAGKIKLLEIAKGLVN